MNDLMTTQEKQMEVINQIIRKSESIATNPNSIELLLDVSSSMDGRKLEDAKTSLLNFLNRINEFECTIGLVTFGATVENTSIGTNRGYLESKIKSLEVYGSTPMLEALKRTNGLLINTSNSVIVLATDGQPTDASENEILDYATIMKTRGIRIIVIGIGEDVNQDFLKNLASSYADYHFAKESFELKQIYQEVADVLMLPAKQDPSLPE